LKRFLLYHAYDTFPYYPPFGRLSGKFREINNIIIMMNVNKFYQPNFGVSSMCENRPNEVYDDDADELSVLSMGSIGENPECDTELEIENEEITEEDA